MKILHIAPHCDGSGNGVVNVAVDLACKQAELGHVVGFVSAGGSFIELLQIRNVKHFLFEQQWYKDHRLLGGPECRRKQQRGRFIRNGGRGTMPASVLSLAELVEGSIERPFQTPLVAGKLT
jgi:hypothetical protein